MNSTLKKMLPLWGLTFTLTVVPMTSVKADPTILLEAASTLGQLAFGVNKARIENNKRMNLQKGLFSSEAKCVEPVGSMRIHENSNDSFSFYGLPAPTNILQSIVAESNCFTVVNRGAAFAALQHERTLAGNSEFANAQIRSADYILVPEIITQNANAGGSHFGAQGGHNDGLLKASGSAKLSSKKKTSEVVLSLIDVRTSEQILSVTGEAIISDKDWNLLASASNMTSGGSVHLGNWNNTEIGKVIKTAYEKTYKDMIGQVGKKNLLAKYGNQKTYSSLNTTTTSLPAQVNSLVATSVTSSIQNTALPHIESQNVSTAKTLVLKRNARIFKEANIQSEVITEVKEGMLVYPLGENHENMIKVEDEQGRIGWISSSQVNAYS